MFFTKPAPSNLQGVAFNKDRFETTKKKKIKVKMSTMDVLRSPRGKGWRFTKKGEDSTLLSPSNPAETCYRRARNSRCKFGSTMPNSHEVSLRQKRTDEHLLKGEYIRSERYAGHTPKYEGTHSYLASQSLSLTHSLSLSLSLSL